jgi:hypothetical protein
MGFSLQSRQRIRCYLHGLIPGPFSPPRRLGSTEKVSDNTGCYLLAVLFLFRFRKPIVYRPKEFICNRAVLINKLKFMPLENYPCLSQWTNIRSKTH